MNFRDFTPEQLIGKIVLHHDGHGSRSLHKIGTCDQDIVGLVNSKNLYDLKTGNLRGGNTWHKAHCELITDEQANVLRQEWALKKRVKAAQEAITHEIKSGRPTLEQLEAACKALGLVNI